MGGLGHSPKQGEGGSPTLSPFPGERGLGIGIENKHFFEKTYFFCKLKRSASADRSFIFRYNYLLITTFRPSALSTVKCLSVAVCVTVIVSPFLSAITVSSSLASLS